MYPLTRREFPVLFCCCLKPTARNSRPHIVDGQINLGNPTDNILTLPNQIFYRFQYSHKTVTLCNGETTTTQTARTRKRLSEYFRCKENNYRPDDALHCLVTASLGGLMSL